MTLWNSIVVFRSARPWTSVVRALFGLTAAILLTSLHAGSSQAAYGDEDYDCGTGEYTNGEIENVAYSEANSLGHYPGLEDLGYVKRNNLAFWVPNAYATWETANTPYADREYLAIFSAGAQGAGILGTGGRPNVTTGQRDQWSDSFGGGPDRLYRDVCDRGLFGRIRDDPVVRFPAAATNFIVNFDNRYLWTDEPGDQLDLVDAWETFIKSQAEPQRLKGIYLVGASMGGGLMAEMAARLNSSTDGWELVPIIVQGMDPVLGKNRLGIIHPIIPGSTIDNYSSPASEHYFYRANKFPSTTFYDAFPDKDKIRMNTIIGGGVVVGGYDTRAYSYAQPGPAYNDFDLEWMRQTSVDLDHAVIGRNWNAPIVAGTGTVDSYRAMDHYRDSYSELDMRGEPVYFKLVSSGYGGPTSHGVEHDWDDIQTTGSAFYTATDRTPAKLHESLYGTTHTVTVYRNLTTHSDRLINFQITAPPYALGPNAVYGADYEIVGHGSMPADGIEFSILPNQTEVTFDVTTLYNGAVEDDEFIYLEIEDGDFVGIRGNVQQGILIEIIDHNYQTTAESCAAVGLLFDPVTNTCIGQCAPSLPAVPCATLPSKPYLDLIANIEVLRLLPNIEAPLVGAAQGAMTENLAGHPVESKQELEGLIQQLNAASGRDIATEDADALIAEANAVIVLLNAEIAVVPTLSEWNFMFLALVVLAVGTGAITWQRKPH